MTSLVTVVLGQVIATLVLILLVNKGVEFIFSKKLDDNEPRLALVICKGSLFLSSAMILSQVFESMNAVSKILSVLTMGRELWVQQVYFLAIFCGISLACIIVIAWLSVLVYKMLFRKRSLVVEIVRNNTETGIFYGLIVVAFTLALLPAVTSIFDLFIPYPNLPSIR